VQSNPPRSAEMRNPCKGFPSRESLGSFLIHFSAVAIPRAVAQGIGRCLRWGDGAWVSPGVQNGCFSWAEPAKKGVSQGWGLAFESKGVTLEAGSSAPLQRGLAGPLAGL